MNKLAPSILSANFAALGEDVKKAERSGAQYLHVIRICILQSLPQPGQILLQSMQRHVRI